MGPLHGWWRILKKLQTSLNHRTQSKGLSRTSSFGMLGFTKQEP